MDAYLGDFLMGAITLGWIVAALFFVRFWRETHDRLFLIFAISFVILALTRIVMVMWNPVGDEHVHVYWLRLLAYCLILTAIVDKNVRTDRSH
jgi:hypothetical protein